MSSVPATKKLDLASRTLWVAVGQSMVKVSQIVAALLLVRLLSRDDWSRMALLLSVYIAGSTFGTLNLHQSVVFFFGRVDRGDRRGVAVQTIGLLAAAGVVTSLVVVAIAPMLAHSSFHLGPATYYLALALLFEIPSLATSQFLIASERTGLSALFDAVFAMLQLAALCLPPLLGHGVESATMALVGYAVLRLATGIAVTFLVVPGATLRAPRSLIGEQLRYTLPLAASLGIGALNRGIDKWLVAAIDGPELGTYAIAAQEVPLVSVVPYAIGAVLATRMVKAFMDGDRERVRAYWLAQTGRMSLVVVPASIAILLVAHEGITLLFTPEYETAVLPFQLYTCILLLRVAEYGLVLRSAGHTRALWICSVALFVANVVFTVPLTYFFGIVGASAGPLLAALVAWYYALYYVRIALGTDWKGVYPWSLYFQVVGMTAAAGLLVGFGVLAIPGFSGWPALVRLAVKLALFAPLVLAVVRVSGVEKRLPPIPDENPHAA